MVDRDLLDALDDCVDRLGRGQNVDDCLRQYPQYKVLLRPMLEAGLLARRMGYNAAEVNSARERVRARYQQAIRTVPPRQTYSLHWARLVATAFIVLLLALGGLGLAAGNSLPGDALYNVKRFTESVRLILSRDNALEQEFAQRRIDEIQQLVTLQREAEVTFEGEIVAQNGTNWTIAGLTVRVEIGTPGSESVQIADRVEVQAMTTAQGEIVALEIRLLETARPEILPTVTPTLTLTHTPTFTTQPSVTPTSTPSATITDTPTHSPDVCRPQQPDGWIEYVIQRGDTLSGLAARAGITLERLLRTNCLTQDAPIVVGQRIYLPRIVTRPTITPSPLATRQDTNAGRSDNPPTAPPSNTGRPRG
jgi:LysM repeat protein